MCPFLIAAVSVPSFAEESSRMGSEAAGETDCMTMYYEGTPGCMQIGEPSGTACLISDEQDGRRSVLKAAASSEGSQV